MISPEPHPAASDSLQTTLLYRLRTGDQESWRRLDHLYGPVVLGWCRNAGLSPEDAADVQQEVYRAVLMHLTDFRRERPGDSFRGWLYTISLNKIRDHWRRQNRQVAAAGGTVHYQELLEVAQEHSGMTSTQAAPDEAAQVHRRALELLQSEFQPRTWQAFWGVAVEGKSAAEMAAELGMSVGAVFVAKSRVLKRLREEFGDLLE